MGKTYTKTGQTEKRTSWNKSRTHRWITTYELVEVKAGNKKKKKKPATGAKAKAATKPKAAKAKTAKKPKAVKGKKAAPKRVKKASK